MPSNTTLTSSVITKEALIRLKNKLVLAQNVTREYDDKFAVAGAKIGATINLRKPPRYLGRTGEALQVEGSQESFVPLTLDTLAGCDISFSTTDLTLNIDDFADRFLEPALDTVANKIDYALAGLYKDVFRLVNHGASSASYGTAGALNGGSQTLAGVQGQVMTAGAILTETGVPTSQRAIVVDPMSQVSQATVMTSLFNPSTKISKIFEDAGFATNTLGFDWAVDANMQQFAPLGSGTATNNSAVPAQGQTYFAIVCTGSGSTAILKQGDVFSVAGVYAINPQSRASTGRLMQFVVTADTQLSAATVNIPCYPAYITSGQFATCTGTASTGAGTVTWHTGAVGAAAQSQGLAFNKGAFALATADLVLPQGVHFAGREVHDGISMRIVQQYDINSNQLPCRIDCLFGVKTIYPELACRIGG